MSTGNNHTLDPGTGNSPAPGAPDTKHSADILNKTKSLNYEGLVAKELPDKYEKEFEKIPLSINPLTDLMTKLGMKVFTGNVQNEILNEAKDTFGDTLQKANMTNITGCVVNSVKSSMDCFNNIKDIGSSAMNLMDKIKEQASNFIDITSPEGKQIIDDAYKQLSSSTNTSSNINSIVDKLQKISFISFDADPNYKNSTNNNYYKYVTDAREKALVKDPEAVITNGSKDYQVSSTARSMDAIIDKYQQALSDLINDLSKSNIDNTAYTSNMVSALSNTQAKLAIVNESYNNRYHSAFSQSKIEYKDLPSNWRDTI